MARGKRTKKLSTAEIIAYTILGEAGGEGDAGMARVAQVIKNRATSGRYPTSAAAVATQHSTKGTYQFTTWSPLQGNNPIKKFSKDSTEFKNALKIANAVLYGDLPDPTGGALNYYANQGLNAIGEPGWFAGEATAGAIQAGNHLFAAKTAPAVDDAAYNLALSAAIQGAPLPLNVPQSVTNLRNGLSRGGLTLPAPLIPATTSATPQGQTSSRGAAGAAKRRLTGGDQQVLGGLITRRVQTVPIAPGTGQDPIYTGLNGRSVDTAIDYMSMTAGERKAANKQTTVVQTGGLSPTERDEAKTGIQRNVKTTTVRSNGSTSSSSQAGDVQLPAGIRPPSLPKVFTYSEAANANLTQAKAEQKTITKMVAKTILVQNPEWGKVNPVAVSKLQDIHDKNDDRIMAAQQGLVAAEVPQFIEQTIMVPVQQTVTIPAAPAAAAAEPKSRVLQGTTTVDRYREQGYSPSDAYDMANSEARRKASQSIGGSSSSGNSSGNLGGVSSSGRRYDYDNNVWV